MKRSYSDSEGEDRQVKSQRRHGGHTAPEGSSSLQTSVNSVSSTSNYDNSGVDLRKIMDEFIAIYERLDTSDDPEVKPNYSYTELVYLSLLRSPNFCLPINEIYKYIQDKFQFFQRNTRQHWRNAVRHSLSKTKCFTNIGVRRGPNSSGTYNRSMFLWTFYPSSIVNFARGDYRPSVDKESGTNTLRWGYYRINAGEFWDRVAVALEMKMTSFREALAASPIQAQIFELQTCYLSSTDSLRSASSPDTTSHVAPDHYSSPPQPATVPAHHKRRHVQHKQHVRRVPHHMRYSPLATPEHCRPSASYQHSTPALSHSTSGYRIPASSHINSVYSGTSPDFHFMKPCDTSPVCSTTSLQYQAHTPCHTSPSIQQSSCLYSYAKPEYPSPTVHPVRSTPVQSLPSTACLLKSPVEERPSVSYDGSLDILSSAWESVSKSSTGFDPEFDLSWASSHDSGVGTDLSSHDNSYLQAFIDGRPFHSPPQNVNIFSPSYRYSRQDVYQPLHAVKPGQQTTLSINPSHDFSDVHLLPEVSLSALMDMTSAADQCSVVMDALSDSTSDRSCDMSSPRFAVPPAETDYISAEYSPSPNPASACVYSSGSSVTSHSPSLPSCMFTSGFELDFLQGLDESPIASTDISSFSH